MTGSFIIFVKTESTYDKTFFKWDNNKINEFLSIFKTKQCDFVVILKRCKSDYIDTVVDSFIQILSECSNHVFGCTHKSKTKHSNNNNKKSWFNSDFFTTWKQFKKARNVFVKDKSNVRQEYLNAKNNYNKIKRAQKYQSRKKNKFKSFNYKFWKRSIEQYAKTCESAENLDIDDFYTIFKRLYSSDNIHESDEELWWRSRL